MNKHRCKRLMALLLAAVLTVSGIQIPSASVFAAGGDEQPVESSVPTGVIKEDETETNDEGETVVTKPGTLTYGDRSSLDGKDFAPCEIEDSDQIDWFTSEDGNVEITMVFRLNEAAIGTAMALFTLEIPNANGNSQYITAYYRSAESSTGTGKGAVSFLCADSSDGIRWSDTVVTIKDTKYHKLSMSLSDKKLNASMDGLDIEEKVQGGNKWWFDNIEALLKNADRGETKLYLGKKAKQGVYKIDSWAGATQNINGFIKYVQFSKTAYTQNELLARNRIVDEDLKTAFDEYVAKQAQKEQSQYLEATWTPFAAALQAAQSATMEQEIYNTYPALKAAEDGLLTVAENKAPVAKEGVSRTLIADKTLSVYAKELAKDPEGGNLSIKGRKEGEAGTSALDVRSEDGVLKISLKEGASAPTSETVTCVVTDGLADIDVPFTVDVEDSPYLLKLEDLDLDPAQGKGVTVDLKDARKVSQLEDSLNITFTFKYDGGKKSGPPNQTIFSLFGLADSDDEIASSISLLVRPSDGRTWLATAGVDGGNYAEPGVNIESDKTKYHTLTASMTKDGLAVCLDNQTTARFVEGSKPSGKPVRAQFLRAFFGETENGYTDWRSRIDKLTIGEAAWATAYNKFGGEIKSLVITTGDSDVNMEELHKVIGSEDALAELKALYDSAKAYEDDKDVMDALEADDAYVEAGNLLGESATKTTTYAADIYNRVIPALSAAITNANNAGMGDYGTAIISGMFGDGGDNTWLFGGGVETQGRFEEIGGARSYIYQFEEYVRWLKATSADHRQRYTVSVGKEGTDAAAFAGKLDSYIEDLKPKAVAYLIGPEDYQKGSDDETIAAFKEALTSILGKSLAARNNNGFAVIQLPHALQTGAEDAENVLNYVKAAKSALRDYVTDHEDAKSRIVLVDHYNNTNTAEFKRNGLTTGGYLNRNGHYELGKEFAAATFGSTAEFQAQQNNWTLEETPETYSNVCPTVTAAADGVLQVTIPDSVTCEDGWNYTLEIGGMEVGGTAEGSTFTIDQLEEGEKYVLSVCSADGKVQLAKAYGTVTEGETDGAEALTGIAQAIRAKVDENAPLTWLFMGDSITHGALWTYDHDSITQTFEKYLKEDLGRTDDIVINTAVSSATAAETLSKIDQRLERYKPDIVSVMLGTNDANDKDAYKTNLNAILAKIRGKNENALIILRTPTPTSDSSITNKLEGGLLKACEEVADADGNVLYIDQYTEWNKELKTFGYLYGTSYYYGNNLHPGVAGHLRMAQQFIRECGLSTDTRISNISYRLPYTEAQSQIMPSPRFSQDTVILGQAEMERLQEDYGEDMGSFEVILTDEENGRTYTQRGYMSDNGITMDHLACEGERTYKVQVIGTASGSAKRVSFKETELTLSSDDEKLAFEVLLNNKVIRDGKLGSKIGDLSVSSDAPEDEYSYELVDGEQYADNAIFEIEGTALKIRTYLPGKSEFQICVQATGAAEETAKSQKQVITLRRRLTLQSIREQARDSFMENQMSLDLDLSDISFGNGTYVDLADTNSDWYHGGDYLKVLNNLRQHSTGGTIIYRFKTSQPKGMIFGSGSSSQYDKNTMCFGLLDNQVRGYFRNEDSTALRGSFDKMTMAANQWHTVAISFDTTKADYQNEILISVDGSNNIYTTAWWNHKYRSWFNMNPSNAVTQFAIGGGYGTSLEQGTYALGAFTGNIDFVTVTDTPYTEQELKTITETPVISGQQNLTISGNHVEVPENAHYTASDPVWSESDAVAEFTLTAEDGMLFNAAGTNPVTVSVTSDAMEFVNTDARVSPNGKTMTVTVSTQPWREDVVFETGELTFKDGTTTDDGAQVSEAVMQTLDDMRRGSVTVRYKLSQKAASSKSNIEIFSVSGQEGSKASFYLNPSDGTIGYEVRNKLSVVNADYAVLTDINNTDWHTITYVFEASGTAIYLDTELEHQNAIDGFFKSVIGANSAKIGSANFDGEINLLSVTYDALHADEVETLHAATTGEKKNLPSGAVKTDDKDLFRRNENDAFDYSRPSLLTTSSGTTIAAVDKRVSDVEMGNIDTVVRTSTDSGANWTSAEPVFDQPSGEAEDSFTTAPSLVEDKNGRIHMITNMFPESQGMLSTELIETGSGFKKVGDKLYPILRNYLNTALNATGMYTQEYTVREDGIVYEENADGTATETDYKVKNLVAAVGGGELVEVGANGQETPCGNIYVYTGANAGRLKAPRVASLVSCYSDDDGVSWEGYQNITGMVKRDWVKYINVTPGVGICLKNQTGDKVSLNGTLMVPIYHANDRGPYSYSSTVIYSADNGETWQIAECPLSRLTDIEEETGTFMEEALREAQVVEMSDGTIQMFCSTYVGSVKVCTGTANAAEGVHWEKISETPIPDVGNQLSVILAPEQIDGKEAVIVSKPAGPGASNGYVRIALYDPATKSFDWKYLHKMKAGEFGDSCLSVLKDGKIGLLYKAGDSLTFASATMDYLTAPRYAAFGTPVIQDIVIEEDGQTLNFTVSLDSSLMKKGNPILKIKLNDTTEAQAAYVSGNASKEYKFTYDLEEMTVRKIEAINVGVADDDTASFIEGVKGTMPEDPEDGAHVLLITIERYINQINALLDNEEYKTLFAGDGKEYTNEAWDAFQKAYKEAQEAIEGEVDDINELKKLANALSKACKDLASGKLPADVINLIGQLESALTSYGELAQGDGEDYVTDTWDRFQNAYKAVQKALEDREQDKTKLQEALTELRNAHTGLREKGPDTPVVDPDVPGLIDDLQGKVNEFSALYEGDGTGYDAEAWAEFRAAYEAVDQALAEGEKDKDRLRTLLNRLTAAEAALKGQTPVTPPADQELEQQKTSSRELLNKYSSTYNPANQANYTPDSWKKFSDAYSALEKALKGTADKATLKKLQDELTAAFGKLDKVKTAEKLAAPAVTVKYAVEKKKLGVKITVAKVANASSYTVYRAIGSKVTKIGDANAAGVIYDENPVNKKAMSYYAVANSNNPSYLTSDKGAAKSLKLAASTKKITAKQVKKKMQVKLSWPKVKGAKQYIVYRSMKKNGGFEKVATSKKPNYTDKKKIKKGKTYYYRIVVKVKKGYTGITTSKPVKIKK